jgi:hypothetical protein
MTDAVRAAPLEPGEDFDDGFDIEKTDNMRPPLREAPRELSPQARAAKRAAEILGDIQDLEEGPDEFAVDSRDIPEGWTYEWKRQLLPGNAEDPAYEVATRRKGWEPVPASRHPQYMPSTMRDGPITRKGMILMERPQVITDQIKAADRRRARDQISQKQSQLNQAPDGQFERATKDRSLVKISTSFEPMDVPE